MKTENAIDLADSSSAEQDPRSKWFRRKWLIVLVISLSSIALIVIGYDLTQSFHIKRLMSDWENGISRDENGVAEGHQDYSVGSGPNAILFVHGLNDSPICWKYMASDLAGYNYYCRVTRLPGFAETVDNYSKKSDTSLWLDSIKREMEILRRTHDKIFVVAHSLGCALMLRYMLENEGEIAGIAILAPAIDVPSHAKRNKVFADCFFHFTTVVPASADKDVPVNDPKEQGIKNRMGFTPLKTVNELFQLIKYLRNRANDISIPVFVATGRDDKIVDSKAIKDFYNNIGSGIKEEFECKRSSHKISVDRDHEELTKKIAGFFDAIK